MTDLLVIGYGNDLRSDDGAGRAVAAAVARRGLPGVDVRSQSQLTPELSLDISGCEAVVFVDADVDVTELRSRQVGPGRLDGGGLMTHHGDPAALLALAENVGPVPSKAFVLSVPATNLELGFDLSPSTAHAVEEAVELIVEFASRRAGLGRSERGPTTSGTMGA